MESRMRRKARKTKPPLRYRQGCLKIEDEGLDKIESEVFGVLVLYNRRSCFESSNPEYKGHIIKEREI